MNGFKNYEEMFAQSIGLTEPWHIEKAEFNEEKREVHIYAEARKTAKYPCPKCGKMCERYDDEETERVNKYLKCLEDAFLIESAQRYDIKGKAYIETPKKYYFSDLGLRNARINFRQFEQTHTMENVIYNELKMRDFNVDVGVVPIAERNDEGKVVRKQLEVDFVCNLGSKRYYIQSAYSLPNPEKQEQELKPLCKIDDSFKKIIITRDIVPSTYDENGVLTVNIYDFLLDKNIFER